MTQDTHLEQNTQLTLLAPAKINLTLKILGKREDGYHELETLMQKVSLFDELELSLTSEPGITIHCPNADLPEDKNNIAVRAAQLFLKESNKSTQGVKIIIKKNIPIAAGLGGGSSDAAAVLNGLDQLLKTGYSAKQRAGMGVRIGADVPLFIYDYPAAIATGIGEQLLPAPPLTNYQILLVNPGILVSTQWAFETFSSATKKITLTAEKKTSIFSCSENNRHENSLLRDRTIPEELKNDLEQVTAKRYPVIQDLKEQLLNSGATGAMMSGSGSTVFGLFHRQAEDKAKQCCNLLQEKYDQVYLVSPLAQEEIE
ncbi:MAG: 4-(cytidine 5'-diphospho)-2-C-methyl-D-erythritol kinase [Candidatus Electrothrix sp. ATG2]|nr:4-(cytidine 5'-diphospho)-2-C-methyl-D-erythritol kinase [Candidatus Electrothrix sp. ATG2]